MQKFLVYLKLSLVFMMYLISNCSNAQTDQSWDARPQSIGADGYPDLWWAPVEDPSAPSWEILPQTANRAAKEVILSKRNELGVFSNLSASPFELDGVKYASLEALWQSLKYPEGPDDERLKDKTIIWPYTRDQVRMLTSFESKDAGNAANANMKKLGIAWVTYQNKKMLYKTTDQMAHYALICRATMAKFEQNKIVSNLLAKTKGLKLLPDHKEDTSAPAYKYFDIWMRIRDQGQCKNI